MSAATRIAISGAAGRMGRTLVAAVQDFDGLRLSGAVEAPGNACLGQDAGMLAGIGDIGVPVGDSLQAIAADFDVLIDTNPTPSTTAFRTV